MMRRSGEWRHQVLLDHAGSCSLLFPNRTLAPLPPPPSAMLSWCPGWSLAASASCDAGGLDGDACFGKTLFWVTVATVIPAIFRRESSPVPPVWLDSRYNHTGLTIPCYPTKIIDASAPEHQRFEPAFSDVRRL